MTCEKLTGAPCLLIQLCETFPSSGSHSTLMPKQSYWSTQFHESGWEQSQSWRENRTGRITGHKHISPQPSALQRSPALHTTNVQDHEVKSKSWPETDSNLNGCPVFECWADWNLLWDQTCPFKSPYFCKYKQSMSCNGLCSGHPKGSWSSREKTLLLVWREWSFFSIMFHVLYHTRCFYLPPFFSPIFCFSVH